MVRDAFLIILVAFAGFLAPGPDFVRADDLEVETGRAPGRVELVFRGRSQLHYHEEGYQDADRGIPIRRETRFELASISKQFTAMGIALLMRDGVLRLEDRVSKFIEDWPRYAFDVEVGHLVYHLSGLPDYMEIEDPSEYGVPFLSRHILEFLRDQEGLDFPAGSKPEYSNTGYVVLALVIAAASGKPYPVFLKERIFQPLGMNETEVRGVRRGLRQLAIPYTAEAPFERVAENPFDYIVGDGGVVTTVLDLRKWIHALRNHRLLSSAKTEALFRSGVTNDGTPVKYGFGWMLDQVEGGVFPSHTGSWYGVSNAIIVDRDSGLCAIVLSNHEDWSSDTRAAELFQEHLGN